MRPLLVALPGRIARAAASSLEAAPVAALRPQAREEARHHLDVVVEDVGRGREHGGERGAGRP